MANDQRGSTSAGDRSDSTSEIPDPQAHAVAIAAEMFRQEQALVADPDAAKQAEMSKLVAKELFRLQQEAERQTPRGAAFVPIAQPAEIPPPATIASQTQRPKRSWADEQERLNAKWAREDAVREALAKRRRRRLGVAGIVVVIVVALVFVIGNPFAKSGPRETANETGQAWLDAVNNHDESEARRLTCAASQDVVTRAIHFTEGGLKLSAPADGDFSNHSLLRTPEGGYFMGASVQPTSKGTYLLCDYVPKLGEG